MLTPLVLIRRVHRSVDRVILVEVEILLAGGLGRDDDDREHNERRDEHALQETDQQPRQRLKIAMNLCVTRIVGKTRHKIENGEIPCHTWSPRST